jgi:2'-hydroxyisoflavone reductase
MRLLLLGGTAWLGGQIAGIAVERGHSVTALARGTSGPVPPGVHLVVADRDTPDTRDSPDTPDAYAAVPGEWDAVLDVTRHPGHVRGAASALNERAAYFALVSSASVYAANDTPGGTTTDPLLPPIDTDLMQGPEVYGEAKVACEQAALAGFGADRTLIARAGLIGGPGDESSRSGYWPWRFAHPGTPDGAVVVPDVPGLATQVIDVRDLAGWLVDCCERRTAGIVDAVGEMMSLPEHLAVARAVAGHQGQVLRADPDWLVAQGIQHWSGERSLPMWLPLPEYAGFMARAEAPARAVGLHPRPLAQTLADALAWEESRGAVTDRASGLSDDDARDLAERLRSGATTG